VRRYTIDFFMALGGVRQRELRDVHGCPAGSATIAGFIRTAGAARCSACSRGRTRSIQASARTFFTEARHPTGGLRYTTRWCTNDAGTHGGN
jgi:hypothetical protein